MKPKTKHKKLAYYLANLGGASLPDFRQTYANGFLIERSDQLVDSNVMFQFFTEVVDDTYVLEQLKATPVQADVLEARVIEIKKRKSSKEFDWITIGRSPDCDIILYNRLVSRTHAYFLFGDSDEICYVMDLDSANGTFINAKRIPPHKEYQLTNIDEISFGPETKLVYFSAEVFHSFLEKLLSSET
jgi:pSer/pThr/pTyr-binding forkhead associated (FHA) protein